MLPQLTPPDHEPCSSVVLKIKVGERCKIVFNGKMLVGHEEIYKCCHKRFYGRRNTTQENRDNLQ